MDLIKKMEILDKSNLRYKEITKNCCKKKFDNLALWQDFQSKSFKRENNNDVPRFKKYKRGTIVFANFGTSIGTELSGNHFAIILNKKDNPLQGSLTVIPLTSKNKKYNLPLKEELIRVVIDNIMNQTINLSKVINQLRITIYGDDGKKARDEGEIVFIDDQEVKNYIKKHINKKSNENGAVRLNLMEVTEMIDKNLDMLKTVSDYYQKNNKASFAMIDSITTISKHRIKKPLNKMDPIGKVVVSDEVLNLIDNKLIETFTFCG